MNSLIEEILDFLKSSGFDCSVQVRNDFEVICTDSFCSNHKSIILPLVIKARTCSDAEIYSREVEDTIRHIYTNDGIYPLIIIEDRWHTQRAAMTARILAHLEVFSPIYARNCEVRRIDKSLAKEFLETNHSYGHAACRYCYGMFLKRHTGHVAVNVSNHDPIPGTLVAVATFSNARKWAKGDKIIRSYEWTRYASLPGVRLSGGMGRMLKTFIKEVQPDDIMSYADLEWSAGEVYKQLGFELEGHKAPVLFTIDTDTWRRTPVKPGAGNQEELMSDETYFQNLGSNKYRLKLTDYK